ncbi:hypothetical protein HGRIS_003829 [Hohenbuehelia grisea]|uniref:Protein-S-isoprenylcysteine O-methyltransferase n=1 Tax=Hohenbuehelia grisea TaxID=104357 RepID=A0ABR3JI92_9AGAR
MSSLLKPLGFAVAAYSYRRAITPPLPPPNPTDRIFAETLFEKSQRHLSLFMRSFLAILFITEIIVDIVAAYPQSAPPAILQTICPRAAHSDVTSLLKMSPIFLAGLSLTILGAQLRLSCFRTMGKQFTFEVTLRHSHKLITAGPYGYARHPSYFGSVMMISGSVLLMLDEGGWLRQCGVLWKPFGIPVTAFVALSAWTLHSLWARTWLEDANLRERFGKEWEQYRVKVPYRMVPGLY